MTTAQIQTLIFEKTGQKVGCKKLTGSMKDYTRFQILGGYNPTKRFTQEQQDNFKSQNYFKCYVDENTIDVWNICIELQIWEMPKHVLLNRLERLQSGKFYRAPSVNPKEEIQAIKEVLLNMEKEKPQQTSLFNNL